MELGDDLGRGSRLTPIQNAPPKSLRATQGQGSREWSMVAVGAPRAVALIGRQGGLWQWRKQRIDGEKEMAVMRSFKLSADL